MQRYIFFVKYANIFASFVEFSGKSVLYDGAVMVEAWKYPALVMQEDGKQYVDKLSLYLSLQDNKDPRVEGELERLINEMIWKD